MTETSTSSTTGAEPKAGLAGFIWPALWGLTLLLMGISLYEIFFVAPAEAQMGIVQKIFYFHVPSAYAMYVGFVTSGVASGIYLARRDERWDALAVAGAEVGLAFCVIVLTTGPLWARKAWGVWWAWDPRLTTTLLAGMIYVAFVSLRGSGAAGQVEKRFAAGLAVLGLPVLVVIHYSVQRWRGQHPTVITKRGGGLDPAMYPAFFLSLAAFTALVALLIWARARAERQRQRVAALEMLAAEQDLLEGEG
jgi:heme exporter protein C